MPTIPLTPAPNSAPTALTEPAVRKEENSYGQILKSTAWVGGSSVVNILIGIARTKVMAMLLGPSGFGLAGLYMSVASLTQSVAGMGINSSGVRQIAEAVGSGDKEQIGRTATVLRRTSVVLGLLGSFLLIALADPVSTLTFGNSQHTTGISLLAAAVLLQLISAGQGALLQGMRRISDMAKMGVLGALFGTLATIVLVYFFREQGVVPSLVAVAGISLIVSWWYSRRIRIEMPSLSVSQVTGEASALLKLGFAFMVSSLLMMGSAYAIRLIVVRQLGLEATGLYQAAWTLGGLYVGMILQAMGADFYPRLTAVASDHSQCNRIVNEQARVSMLLAGPGVLATLTFAPLVISVLFAPNFAGSVDILRWICLGIAMRVISWPLGFIIMAKGRQTLIIFCELAWTAVHLGLAWICVRSLGLTGAGIAFFGSYLFHILLTYAIVHTLVGFRWSIENKQTALVYLSLIMAIFVVLQMLPGIWAFGLSTLAVILSGFASLRVLLLLVPSDRIPGPVRFVAAYSRRRPTQ